MTRIQAVATSSARSAGAVSLDQVATTAALSSSHSEPCTPPVSPRVGRLKQRGAFRLPPVPTPPIDEALGWATAKCSSLRTRRTGRTKRGAKRSTGAPVASVPSTDSVSSLQLSRNSAVKSGRANSSRSPREDIHAIHTQDSLQWASVAATPGGFEADYRGCTITAAHKRDTRGWRRSWHISTRASPSTPSRSRSCTPSPASSPVHPLSVRGSDSGGSHASEDLIGFARRVSMWSSDSSPCTPCSLDSLTDADVSYGFRNFASQVDCLASAGNTANSPGMPAGSPHCPNELDENVIGVPRMGSSTHREETTAPQGFSRKPFGTLVGLLSWGFPGLKCCIAEGQD